MNTLEITHPQVFAKILFCCDKFGVKTNFPPNQLTKGSVQFVMVKCPKVNCLNECEHIFKVQVYNLTSKKATPNYCPYCSSKKICPCHSLEKLQPNVYKMLDLEKNASEGIDVSQIMIGSRVAVFCKCLTSSCSNQCPHVWKTQLSNLTRNKSGCPYCCLPAQRVCKCNSLSTKYSKLIDLDWDKTENDKINLNPSELPCQSGRKAHWKCHKCDHKWTARIQDRTLKDSGCPECATRSKMERNMKEILDDLQASKKIQSFTHDKRLPNSKLRADFLITCNNGELLDIEMDGQQHFGVLGNFGSKSVSIDELFQKVHQRDIEKNAHCQKLKIHMMRISYKVNKDKYQKLVNDMISLISQKTEHSTEVYVQFEGY